MNSSGRDAGPRSRASLGFIPHRRLPFFQVGHDEMAAIAGCTSGRQLALARSVYLALVEVANERRQDAFDLSRSELGRRAGVSTDSVDRVIPILVQADLIEAATEGGHAKRWNLVGCRWERQGVPLGAAGGAAGSGRFARAGDYGTSREGEVKRESDDSLCDQLPLDRALEVRVDRFLDVHGERVEARGARRPSRTPAAREAARWILTRESDARAIVARLDWALQHQFWSDKVLTLPSFRKYWERLTVQWRAASEAEHRRSRRDNRDDGRSERFGQADVSYDEDKVVIRR